MPAKASIWSGYRWRIGLIGGICLGFSGWCLYDGAVRYPRHNDLYDAFVQLPLQESILRKWWPAVAREGNWQANPGPWVEAYQKLPDLADAAKIEALWNQARAQNRWPDLKTLMAAMDRVRADQHDAFLKTQGITSVPRFRKRSIDVMLQFIMLGVTCPFGLIFAIAFARTFGRWIASDATGLTTSWGQHITYDAIRRLNKGRWAKKGIAVVHHDGGKLVLDDWKFERQPMDQIVEEVESHISADLIEPASVQHDAAADQKGPTT